MPTFFYLVALRCALRCFHLKIDITTDSGAQIKMFQCLIKKGPVEEGSQRTRSHTPTH